MADQENYENNEEMNDQEFMGNDNGDSMGDDDHNGTNGGAGDNAGRDDDR